MDTKTLKTLGLGLLALLVVCNTVRIQKVSSTNKRAGVYARQAMGDSHARQRPTRASHERGAQWSRGQKPERKSEKKKN